MGKKRKRNTNTRRRRQYEARMRGVENALMREAKLVDPNTLTGMTMMSVAELDADSKKQHMQRIERQCQEQEQAKWKEEHRKKQEQISKQLQAQHRQKRLEEEKKHKEYLRVRKPNYWVKKEPPSVGWWEWIFG